jgi:hypothetical protein
MGSYAGAAAIRHGSFSPRLFIAVGAFPDLGENRPPLLLMAGRFEECFPPALLRTRTDARLVISPWSDHALEPFDPYLVNAAVAAACATVGKTPPAAPRRWMWRLAGVVLGILGAFGAALSLPSIFPRLAPVRGMLVPIIVIVVFALSTSTWVGAVPYLRHTPQLIAAIVVAVLVVVAASKLRVPRWSFLSIAAAVWIGCLIAGATKLAFFVSLFGLVLFAGTVLGAIAAYQGSRHDGDMAMAIFIGYAMGQWIPTII